MKYCAFLLRENFTKTFFVFVFILLGFFVQTENAFGAITEVDIVDLNDGQRTTFKALKLNNNFYSIKDLNPQQFTAGKTTTGSTYKIGTVSNDQSQTRVSYNSNNTPNTSDDYVESIETWKDGKYYNFRNLEISQEAGIKNGMLGPVPANERTYKNQQESNGVYNQNYTPEYSSLLNQTQNDFNLQYNQGQTLSTVTDLSDSSSQFTTDWKKNLYKLIDDPTLSTAQKEAIFNATKASYEGKATPEQNALLETVSQQEKNKDTVKKIQEGGKDKYVSKNYADAVNHGKSPEGVAEAVANREGSDSGVCFKFDFGFILDIPNCIEQGLYYLMYMLSLVLGFLGIVLNWVIKFTILNMSKYVSELSVINAAWEVFRDLANILFIFLLLYLSIQTILQTDGGEVKHTLSKLLIVALLLNFSLFFTKVIIDSSNILTITIYEKIVPRGATLETVAGSKEWGLGDAFMSVFQFQKLYSQKGMEKLNSSGTIDLGQAGRNFAQQQAGNALATFTMGLIMIIIASFVFISVIAIFLNRFVVLILLMVTAPLAFVASIFPKTSGMAEEMWWGNLIKNAFYAPLFMVFAWISLKILTATDFVKTVQSEQSSLIPIIVGFIVAIAFLIASLVAAESLHVAGASTAMKWYQGMQGWAGKNTFGRAAYNMLEKNHDVGGKLYELAAHSHPLINTPARFLKDALHSTANKNFDNIPGAGGHGDHGGKDGSAHQGGYANKMKLDVKNRQDFRADQQKDDASGWVESFDLEDSKLVENKAARKLGLALWEKDKDGKLQMTKSKGYFHNLKIAEQDYESMPMEDKAELMKAFRYKIEELRGTGEEKDSQKADRLEAMADHLKESRTDAKDLEQLEKRIEVVSTIDKKHLDRILEETNEKDKNGKTRTPEAREKARSQFSSFFSNQTDKQRGDLISGQIVSKQTELARNPLFVKETKKHIKNYAQIDLATKGGNVSKEMKEVFSEIAYSGIERGLLHTELEKNPSNKLLQERFKDSVSATGVQIEATDNNEDVVNKYKQSGYYESDQTVIKGENNLQRLLPANEEFTKAKEYIELSKQASEGLQQKALGQPKETRLDALKSALKGATNSQKRSEQTVKKMTTQARQSFETNK